MGIPSHSVVPRLLPIVDGPLHLTPPLEVDGKLGCDISHLRAIALFQAFPHAAVHLHPLELPQPLGQHLAIERMVKPVAPADGPVRPLLQAGVLQEVVLLPERRTEGFDLGHRDVQPRRHRGGGKHVARHTGHFQDVLRLPLEPLEPFGNQQLRGLRQEGTTRREDRSLHWAPSCFTTPCSTRCSSRFTMNRALPSVW